MTDSGAVMNLLRQVPLFANLKDEDKVCIERAEEWRLATGGRLSPLTFDHINFLGRYAFALPESVAHGQLRPLRSPDAFEDE